MDFEQNWAVLSTKSLDFPQKWEKSIYFCRWEVDKKFSNCTLFGRKTEISSRFLGYFGEISCILPRKHRNWVYFATNCHKSPRNWRFLVDYLSTKISSFCQKRQDFGYNSLKMSRFLRIWAIFRHIFFKICLFSPKIWPNGHIFMAYASSKTSPNRAFMAQNATKWAKYGSFREKKSPFRGKLCQKQPISCRCKALQNLRNFSEIWQFIVKLLEIS